MSSSRAAASLPAGTRQPRRGDGYHHGDLRRALLHAGLALVAERGVDGLTLREVARRAGVSRAAPYHHFADKSALVAALAERGFEELEAALRAVAEGEPGTPLDRLRRLGVGYVRYAVEHPATFRLLFRPELRLPVLPGPTAEGSAGSAPGGTAGRPDLDAAAHAGLATFRLLRDTVVAARNAGLVAGETDALALAAWCSVHGLATLLLDGPLAVEGSPAQQADVLADQVTAVLAHGLLPR